jgi:ketosteroid isomerase-like protein
MRAEHLSIRPLRQFDAMRSHIVGHQMTTFDGLGPEQAREFAEDWLPAWTGNDPERLAAFYAEDAFYADPAIPDGVTGRDAITAYFTRLLANFPDWVWTQTAATPMAGGFLNHWHAEIPIGSRVIAVDGVCTVSLRDGLIERNEVFFDRSELLAALRDSGQG